MRYINLRFTFTLLYFTTYLLRVADYAGSKAFNSWKPGAMSATGSSDSDSRHQKMVCVLASLQ